MLHLVLIALAFCKVTFSAEEPGNLPGPSTQAFEDFQQAPPTPYWGDQIESGDSDVAPNDAPLDIIPEWNEDTVQLADPNEGEGGGLGELAAKSKPSRGCTDGAGADLTCYAPGGVLTWRYYKDTGAAFLYTDSACTAALKCSCGDAKSGGPCNGCGYQDQWNSSSCFSNSACTTACTAVPEFSGIFKNFAWLIGLVVLFLVWRRKKDSQVDPPQNLK